MKRKLGWIRDVHDVRDFKFAPKISKDKVPDNKDLRKVCPVIVDQGNLGSCVGNATAGAIQIQQIKQGKVYYNPVTGRTQPYSAYVFAPSRLFIYYGARELEGSVTEDAGCQIRDAIKYVAANGVCTSSKWPYHTNTFAVKPKPECYAEAKDRGQILSYHRLNNNNLNELIACLAQGEPFVFGFSVYDSFMTDTVAATGIVPLPSDEEFLQGGHAVCAVGYNKLTRMFLVRNSWGTGWGLNGYCWMPFEYLINHKLADDFWTITLVE